MKRFLFFRIVWVQMAEATHFNKINVNYFHNDCYLTVTTALDRVATMAH